jgi:pimeloyl-ACP methyl ester carboxylesterase
MNDIQTRAAAAAIQGQEHWTTKGDARLFLWEKRAPGGPKNGTVLFVHGSSMASQPVFDLHVPGRPNSSAMEYFCERGFDAWCMDMEGYGRSTKDRGTEAFIWEGADDLDAGSDYIMKTRNSGPLMVYGISSGALRAAAFAQRRPERVKRLALDAHVWTGEGSPTLEQRRKKLPEYLKTKRRPIDRAFVRSIFERDHPGTADDNVIEAFADEILKLDDSIPNGTYIDMCNNLPVVDPLKIKVPTIIMRGEYDGIAGLSDLIRFFELLPNPDKQFAIMPGIAHASLQQKNYLVALHIMHAFFTQPEPVYSTYKP